MAKLDIQRGSGELTITYSWRTPVMWFLLFFSVVWNLIAVGALIAGAGLFMSIHLLAGIGIAWLTLTRLLNKTTLNINRQRLAVTHGPVPWPFAKEQDIPARSLVQLWVEKSNVTVNNKPTYNLMARLDNGVKVKLLGAEADRALLQQLETTIETYLNIDNDNSFDLEANADYGKLDLEQMREQMEMLDPIKKWLPQSIVTKMNEAQLKMEAEAQRRKTGPVRSSSTKAGRDERDVAVNFPTGNPRPLPEPDHNYAYPLFRAARQERLSCRDRRYEIGRSAQLDFDDDHVTTGRQLELVPLDGQEELHVYAQIERERWSYFEERRLDDDEVAHLGFTGEVHPLRFDNGAERYYPRNEQTGTRYLGRDAQTIQQFIYFTTSSQAQFRSLKPEGRGWEMYVMEPVDVGFFEKA
jgi:hypothetical protein